MANVRSDLWQLRHLRLEETAHNGHAAEYMHRATQGMSMKRATNISGTGDCPLTNYADRCDAEHKQANRARREADTLWTKYAPAVAALDFDARRVMELFYNVGMAWEDIPAAVKRSPKACGRMHRETLARLERALP